TFWALTEVVKADAGILESDGPAEARAKLDRAVAAEVRDEAEREWIAGRLAPLAGAGIAPAAAQREESFSAWRRYLESLVTEHAMVLVFEDLHWADQALIEFIDHLVEWSAPFPILVLCAGRPELYDRFPRWGGGKRNSTTVRLTPLSGSQMSMLVS